MNDQAISFLRRRILVRHHPSAFLLGAQLLSLLFYAAYDEVHSGRALLGAFSVIVLALSDRPNHCTAESATIIPAEPWCRLLVTEISRAG